MTLNMILLNSVITMLTYACYSALQFISCITLANKGTRHIVTDVITGHSGTALINVWKGENMQEIMAINAYKVKSVTDIVLNAQCIMSYYVIVLSS